MKRYTKAEIDASLTKAAALIDRANSQGLKTDKWIDALIFLEERGDPEAVAALSGVPKG